MDVFLNLPLRLDNMNRLCQKHTKKVLVNFEKLARETQWGVQDLNILNMIMSQLIGRKALVCFFFLYMYVKSGRD